MVSQRPAPALWFNWGAAPAVVAVALACTWVAGCNVYDPGLLSISGKPQASDAGSRPVVTKCRAGHDYEVCSRPEADGVCLDGECSVVRCRPGFFDCDQLADNGCEAALDDPDNCGGCGEPCALQHVVQHLCEADAEGAQCTIDHGCNEADIDCEPDPARGCEPGFSDCDGLAANGCEASLRTLGNCGGCGHICAGDVTEGSCDEGVCDLIGCRPGFDDCDGKGCKSLAADADNCGACDHKCGADTPTCAGGVCTAQTCAEQTADCDGKDSNECEADLTSIETCGNCSVRCGPYDHASVTCLMAQCVITRCDAGFADCDEARDNGCETNARTSANCGKCGRDCGELPHVVKSACKSGECTDFDCEPGWGDCDGKSDNGCEQLLNTHDNCETCGGTCEPERGVGSCQTGACVITECDPGFDDCNGKVDDGCEAALDTDADCGKCDNSCQDGKACMNGGCSCENDSGCADGATCCDGVCVFTGGTCVPWPCIPGTALDNDNCGACSDSCLLYCCLGGL